MKTVCLTSRLAAFVALVLFTGACQRTGKLSPALQARFDKEGIKHRMDDVTFRRTRPAGYRDSGWDEKRASIIVTPESILIHVNSKPLIDITPRSTGYYEVHRDHERIALRTGSGGSTLIWSFRPSDDPDSWTKDIRSVIKNAKVVRKYCGRPAQCGKPASLKRTQNSLGLLNQLSANCNSSTGLESIVWALYD